MQAFEKEPEKKFGAYGRRARGVRRLGPSALVLVGVVVLVGGLLAGGVLGRLEAGPTKASATSDHLYLTVAYNPYTGLDQYFPANFTVPANIPVVITITNYDNGTNLVPAAYAAVRGTVDGTETVNGAAVQSVPADQIAHTFTLLAGPYDINIPIPAAQGTTPTVVSFTLVLTQTGVFTWHCMAPCDPDAMDTLGFMMGSMTVVSG